MILRSSLLTLAALTTAVSAGAQTASSSPVDMAKPVAGESLPLSAPGDDYGLTAWCFGALDEYLIIYDRVKPDLRDIDKLFGSSVKGETEPYAQDMAAARDELKVLAGGVEAAEKASPTSIAAKGAAAVLQGRAIWSLAELKSKRELARAWLSWGLPDRCDVTARDLTARSNLLGQALKYNAPEAPAPEPKP